MMLTDLAQVVRASGLKVTEVNGWRTRGHGGFAAVNGVVVHHTAGPATGNMPSLDVVTNGRPDLDGPLCNLALARDGRVYVVAAGVAYHAGKVASSSFDNWHMIGIEAEATGTSKWPEKQMAAYALLCRTLADHYKFKVGRVLGHKEVAIPKGRKSDPNFDMESFRRRVANAGREDWLEMASKEELEALIRKVVREEVRRVPDLGIPSVTTKSGTRKLSGMLTSIERLAARAAKEE